jgi:hypothetical protein
VISSNSGTFAVTPIQLATSRLSRAHSPFRVIHKVCGRDDGLSLESLRFVGGLISGDAESVPDVFAIAILLLPARFRRRRGLD